MIISVASPVHGQGGNSTTALLIALILSKKHTVCLTNISGERAHFFDYLGINETHDLTCTASQIISLLKSNSISAADIKDYCSSIRENLDIFSGIENESETEIIEKLPHDFVIVDVDINPKLPSAQYVFNISSSVIVTLSQSTNVIHRFEQLFKDSNFSDKSIYVCNRYSTTVGSIAAFSRSIGVKQQQCFTLHNCGQIMKHANNGNFAELISKLNDLPDLNADLQKIAAYLLKFKEVKK